MISVLYFFLAALALGILVFVHELGHLIAAKWVGMKVEAFSIGFGRALVKWKWGGVNWQIGWLPFGGYIRIAGMEFGKKDKKNGVEPYDIPDGFFGKSPWKRIVVAFAGPAANLILAFVLFFSLHLMGGREKSFSDFTKIIGWVDPHSQIYAEGVRPGDELISYNNQKYAGSKDLLYAAMLGDKKITLSGYQIDYERQSKTPFSYEIESYQSPLAQKGILTTGVLAGARYLLYDRLPGGVENPLPSGSPMETSGIQYGDRIVWADGMHIFSMEELSHIINDEKALLTVKRGEETFLSRQPRVFAADLALPKQMKNDITDWAYEAGIKGKWQKLKILPYDLNANAVIEGELSFIDKESKVCAFCYPLFSDKLEAPLHQGDKIIAIDGVPVTTAYQLLDLLQARHVNIMVQRPAEVKKGISWKVEDRYFMSSVDIAAVDALGARLGTASIDRTSGRYNLLQPVQPKKMEEFTESFEAREKIAAEYDKQRSKILEMKNDSDKERALSALNQSQNRYLLGIYLADQSVNYNPGPIELYGNVVKEAGQTLKALVMGYLSPKWLSGPVGIVQVIHHGWSLGMGEALFWIGAISLNLAVFNLLPIPVVDGGYIFLSLWEMITRRRLKARTMEKLIVPFVVLLIALLVFLTFQDITRLF